jgi:hypothetical protein
VLFEELVEWLCAQPLEIVGLSGGKPFVERRGLSYNARRVSEAGKKLVAYTGVHEHLRSLLEDVRQGG